MKKLYIIAAGMLTLFASSCIKDKSTPGDLSFPYVATNGLDSSYSVYTYQDTLRIQPSVENESRYEFMWTVYSTNFNVNAGMVPRPDTLSRTRNLEYAVTLNPGQYILIFNVKDKQTSVTDMITRPLSVSSLNMNGWYALKEENGKTDFDYFHPDGRIENWIATYNDGQTLEGSAIKAVFSTSFKNTPTSSDLYNVFSVISDKDAAIFRIDNGKKVMDFDNMFFSKPSVKKPQNVLQPVSTSALYLINNNELYTMTKGSLFSLSNPNTYKLSPLSAIGAQGIVFDENSRSIVLNNEYGAFTALGSNGDALKNMNTDLVWIAGFAGMRSAGLALFQDESGAGRLFKLSINYPSLTNSTYPGTLPLVGDDKPVPATHGLMTADVRAGNYDADYIYYAKENKVYLTNVAGLPEDLQVTLPAGEQVTCIQHVKCPEPQANAPSQLDYLAIASYSNGHYKIWLHSISSTGTIQPLAAPTYEGTGKVTCLNYVQGTFGSRIY